MTPGNRLRRAWMLNGYKSGQALAEAMQRNGYQIGRDKIYRLARNARDPTIYEINALCDFLKMSADWWLRGVESAPEVICRRVSEMPKQRREAILLVLDLLE